MGKTYGNFTSFGIWFNILLALTISAISGCQSQSRVFYEGQTHKKIVSKAELTSLSPDELAEAGYHIIGTFKSEPTTYGHSVSKKEFQSNPDQVLDSIAPENVESLKPYYESLDKEVCRKAADIGGQLIRLEKIERIYPTFSSDIEALMEKAMAADLTVKNVTTVKHWSVWRREP
ncbi:MAG: hypothetical protein JW749_03430 [Sedimentisphaerales bacterium]|nr:hypothetical protein [Sedimentisphaerales bacterium]